MARKRHKPEEIVAKLRQVDVLTAQGKSIGEAVKTIAVTETTYFRWRAEYGAMKSDQVKRHCHVRWFYLSIARGVHSPHVQISMA